MIRRIGLIAALSALVLAGIALFEPRDAPQPDRVATPEGSDYYMREATVTQFGLDGGQRYRVRAAESLHFPDDSMRLDDIHVHYPRGDRGLWTLQARQGRVPPDSRDILLTGDVRLIRNPDSPAPMTVETDRAWVRTEADLAETESAVRASSPGRRARGNGMTVHFNRETLTLHRDVRVTYNP